MYGKAGKPPIPSFKGQNADKVPSTPSDRCFGGALFTLVEFGRIFLQVWPVDSVDDIFDSMFAGSYVLRPLVVSEFHFTGHW